MPKPNRHAITAAMATSKQTQLTQLQANRHGFCWIESRPDENGRATLMYSVDGQQVELTPNPWDARSKVHEYGGGAVLLLDDCVYFVHFSDQCWYRASLDGQGSITPVTQASALRFADACLDVNRNRLLCVAEDHSGAGLAENKLVAVNLSDGRIQAIAQGHDFYSAPRINPANNKLVYLAWDFPNMPWNGVGLFLATVTSDGSIGEGTCIAGFHQSSVHQPQWYDDETLIFVDDTNGWWNLYQYQNGQTRIIVDDPAEYDFPGWQFGQNSYAMTKSGDIYAIRNHSDRHALVKIDRDKGEASAVSTPCDVLQSLAISGNELCFITTDTDTPNNVFQMRLDSENLTQLTDYSVPDDIADVISAPQRITYPTKDGSDIHALFYPPSIDINGARPPLIVTMHGGPTSQSSSGYDLGKQFFCNRGFAVVDVNYRGSTGYGRVYQEQLNGQWGVTDIEDCVSTVEYLAGQGWIDPEKALIRGGSAGGYTVYSALTFTDTFRAGASYFGVSDLIELSKISHKFELRYEEMMVGPLANTQLYYDRSPNNFADQINCPLIILQGLDDKVVPPAQSEVMVKAVAKKQLPYAYITYEGEGHGFRQAKNQQHSLLCELYFYSRVLGLPYNDERVDVNIHHAEKLPEAIEG